MPTDRKSPAAGELHVWRVELAGDERRETARRALAAILADYLGGAAKAALSAGENGKPRLAVRPERLSFNLSHSDGLALVAIAPGGVEVGVDVERLQPRRDPVRLAERWLPTDDARTVASAGADRERAFYAAWTRHEARVKCVGTGLAGPPPPTDVAAFALEIDDGYAAAVALEAAGEPRITLRTWDR
ncbi:MAG TPA: 4'-phosphopantetheinyl transferase superfamily protein [Solirubrobacterales bacterium]|jgi:4'-phosphopantetheinyl transferase